MIDTGAIKLISREKIKQTTGKEQKKPTLMRAFDIKEEKHKLWNVWGSADRINHPVFPVLLHVKNIS